MSAFLRVLMAKGIVFRQLATVIAAVGILCSWNSEAHANTGLEYDDIELVSSVMWQPLSNGKKYLYPPGIPAVLKKSDESRTFKVEQYYNTYLQDSRVKPYVRGTWPKTAEYELQYNDVFGIWSNRYVRVTTPSCDGELTEFGYRCIVEFKFSSDVPTGTIGISISTLVEDVEFTHPNAVFLILLPDQYTPPARVESIMPPAAVDLSGYNSDGDYARKHVVRISVGGSFSLGGSFSVGSGFLTRNVEPLRKLFQPQVFEAIAISDESDIFVVTAAHLFPVAYSQHTLTDPFVFPISSSASFRNGYTYDLQVEGKIIPHAAVILGRNIESDIAIMQIRRAALNQLSDNLGLTSASDIVGLEIGELDFAIDPENTGALRVLGYPAKSQGELVERRGKMMRGELPTDDTSNFGPLRKMKLEAVDALVTDFAEPGMSGGPIVDAHNRVVGLTVEKPNDTNSLIALDLTSIGKVERGYALDERRCMVSFNPFDRFLTIVNKDADCHYGRFGSRKEFNNLQGEWTVQEILGFAEESTLKTIGGHQFTNGHSIINGHAIINGHTIINGHSIIRQPVLIVNRENLDQINSEEIRNGYMLNPDSFKSFLPKGVRILSYSGDDANHLPLGSLILGTKQNRFDSLYQPVYSIREFVIWLHQNADQENYEELLCTTESDCKSN